MVEYLFDKSRRLVPLTAAVFGKAGVRRAQVALAPWATHSVLSYDLVEAAGYDPSTSGVRIRLATVTGIVSAQVVTVDKISVLGREAKKIGVACVDLPAEVRLSGILGQNFLRGFRLTMDPGAGMLTLD